MDEGFSTAVFWMIEAFAVWVKCGAGWKSTGTLFGRSLKKIRKRNIRQSVCETKTAR
jgi:hypothetical protein